MWEREKRGLTGADLKRIAMVSMLIDHIGFSLVPQGALYFLCRAAGRLAFPLYAFLLVEGILHTRDEKKYGRNLFMFALLSEIPFDLVSGGSYFVSQYQNVFFTLFLGFCMLICLRRSSGELQNFLIVLCFAAAAWWIRCDYQMYGIFMIAFFYWYRSRRITLAGPVLFAAFLSVQYFCTAALSVGLIHHYNGLRGEQKNKYLYYFFYPIHLLALYLAACFLSQFQL